MKKSKLGSDDSGAQGDRVLLSSQRTQSVRICSIWDKQWVINTDKCRYCRGNMTVSDRNGVVYQALRPCTGPSRLIATGNHKILSTFFQ